MIFADSYNKFPITDFEFTTLKGGSFGDVEKRITHKPSGLNVSGVGKSQIKLREELMQKLYEMIYEHNRND